MDSGSTKYGAPVVVPREIDERLREAFDEVRRTVLATAAELIDVGDDNGTVPLTIDDVVAAARDVCPVVASAIERVGGSSDDVRRAG